MLKREWQKILKNPWMIIILIAIITIPAIYTSVFLGSMWDPYGDADELPVAVVNHDKKVKYEGKTLQVGDDLVKNLKDSGSLDFRFVSDKKAKEGLESGEYYMIISIPEDFSKNATTLMDKNPKQMKLIYKTNPGTNYVASKMDDSAMAKIEKSVREKVTETYVKTVFAQIKTAGSGFQEAADGSGKIESGAKKLKAGNDTIEQNLNKLASSTLTFQNGAKSLSVGLKAYTDGVAKVDSGAKSLKSGTKTLKDGVAQLSSGATQLSTGSKSLKIGIAKYTNGVSTAQAGSKQLVAKNTALTSGVDQLSEGIKSGTAQLKEGTGSLTTGIDSVLTAAKQSSALIGQQLPESTDIQQLSAGMTQLNDGIQQLNKSLNGSAATTQSTKTTTTTVDNTDSKKAAESAATAKEKVNTLQSKVSKLKNSSVLSKLSDEEKEQLLSEIGEVESVASDVEENVDETYTNAQKASQAKATTTTKVSTQSASSDETLAAVKQQVSALASNSEKVLPKGSQAVTSMYSGLKTVKTGLDQQGTTPETMGMIQALTALKSGSSQVDAGLTTLESGLSTGTGQLKIGIANYTAGVNRLNTGLTTLKNNYSKALNSGAKQLNNGINQVSSNLPTFMSGTTQLYNGTKTLKKGTATLVANNNTLNSGAGQLASGAGQIADGSSKLAAGSTTLGNGIGTLQSGSKTLKDSLQKGADQVNSIKATNKTSKMFAAPVKAKNVEYSHVDNNGHAMAPYMMSVGLFVACMAFTLMYPLMEKNEEVKSGLQWWLSKVTVMAAVSIVQAVIMVAVLMGINGLEPHYVGKTFGMAVLASMAFMSLICFGEMLLNRVGSFVMLVFMVVQLGAAGGTYPLDMAPHFYTVLHKYMPFSYTVHAFRHTLSMDGQIGQDVAVFVGILVVSTLATIIFYRFRMKKQVGGTLEPNGAPQH
ncbi:YhgE/Pip domain-containing protein [Anaerostipes sp.]|uniref:YhgE/Pip domain-containing protein n=3 Tax=Anaerostipes sp. TaxID=1872530 RepID=UPI002E78E41B|nr:YhgE/Pip domain-containing protein [Anaerostipes sp.]MED9813529.1 YhgE/Pip domain-containing protein [Anaerostipes sp.]